MLFEHLRYTWQFWYSGNAAEKLKKTFFAIDITLWVGKVFYVRFAVTWSSYTIIRASVEALLTRLTSRNSFFAP